MPNKTITTENNNKKGQILVMSLIILLVLSIITLSMIVVLSTDAQRQVFNESYDENYYYSEFRLQQTADLISKQFAPSPTPTGVQGATTQNPGPDVKGITTTDLKVALEDLYTTSVGSSSSTSTCSIVLDTVKCTITEGQKTTEVEVGLTNSIDGLEMTGNDVLQLSLWDSTLGQYQGPIRWSWSNSANVLWSISLIYEKSYREDGKPVGTNSTYYEVVKDAYDCRTASNPCATSSFTSTQYNSPGKGTLPNTQATQINLNPATITDPFIGSGRGRVLYLRLRPIITNGGTTSINIEGDSGLPVQFAEIKSQSYEPGIGANSGSDGSVPSPLLTMRFPIVPAPPSLFDYVYYQSRD